MNGQRGLEPKPTTEAHPRLVSIGPTPFVLPALRTN